MPAVPAWAQPRLTSDENLTVDLFKKATPSVVNVTNLALRRDAFTMNMLEFPQGAGSGFFWDNQGRIVTNYHVVVDASDIQVGERFPPSELVEHKKSRPTQLQQSSLTFYVSAAAQATQTT